jgi:hypothetical protein
MLAISSMLPFIFLSTKYLLHLWYCNSNPDAFKECLFYTDRIHFSLVHLFSPIGHNICGCIFVVFVESELFFLYLVVLGGVMLWHLHQFLQCIRCIQHEFTSSTILLHLHPRLIPGVVSTYINFAFTHMCTHFLHCIHPPNPFSWHLPPYTGASPLPGKDLFRPPVLQFHKRKGKMENMTF